MGSTVRINQSIHTEIPIMDALSMIAAIIIHRRSFFRFSMCYRMIAPFPDKTSAYPVIALNHLKIIFKITGAISHAMAIFNQQKWLTSILLQIFLYFFQCRIHAAIQIQIMVLIGYVIIPIPGAFVLCKSCGIECFCPLQCLFKIAAISTFISHRPHNDAKTVLISLNHTLYTVKNRLLPSRIIRYLLIPATKAVIIGILFPI